SSTGRILLPCCSRKRLALGGPETRDPYVSFVGQGRSRHWTYCCRVVVEPRNAPHLCAFDPSRRRYAIAKDMSTADSCNTPISATLVTKRPTRKFFDSQLELTPTCNFKAAEH
ncbi:unnamed protein product, partial [Discosporangium mesarthrocarpum]